MGCGDRIERESLQDVLQELFFINHDCCTESGDNEGACAEIRGELFGGKNGSEIMWINTGVATITLFRVDVPSYSQSVGFSTKMSRTKVDNKVEL